MYDPILIVYEHCTGFQVYTWRAGINKDVLMNYHGRSRSSIFRAIYDIFCV